MTTKKSTVLTNLEAIPQVLNDAGTHNGRVRCACDSFEVATTDIEDDDIILFDLIPANAIILGLYFLNDDLDSNATETLAPDIGLYEPDGSTVADVDAFASATTLFQDINSQWIDVLAEAAAVPMAKIGNRLYDWAGDTEGEFEEYYVAWTFSGSGGAATGVAGTIAYRIDYAVD